MSSFGHLTEILSVCSTVLCGVSGHRSSLPNFIPCFCSCSEFPNLADPFRNLHSETSICTQDQDGLIAEIASVNAGPSFRQCLGC